MSEQAAPGALATMAELEALARTLIAPALIATTGSNLAMEYALATLIVAAAERGAIDPARVFQLLAFLAEGFERALDSEAAKMTATTLRRIEETYRNLTTVPAGAGHA